MTFSAVPLFLVLRVVYPLVVTACAVVGVWRYRELVGARRWLAWWLIANAVASLSERPAAIFLKNTQYVAMVWYPISACLAVCVLAASASDARSRRRGFNLAIVALLAVVGTIVAVEEFGAFARAAGALHGLIVLAVGARLVLNRAAAARGDLLRDALFLLGAGFMLAGAPGAFQALASRYFGTDEIERRALISSFRAVLAMLGYLCMARAFLVPGHNLVHRSRNSVA